MNRSEGVSSTMMNKKGNRVRKEVTFRRVEPEIAPTHCWFPGMSPGFRGRFGGLRSRRLGFGPHLFTKRQRQPSQDGLNFLLIDLANRSVSLTLAQ